MYIFLTYDISPFIIENIQHTSTGNGTKVAAYIRVSTQEQKTQGYGLEAQERNLKEYLSTNTTLGLKGATVQFYRDVHTGSQMNRTALQQLIEDVEAKRIHAVVVWKIDRLSRSLKHLIHLVEIFQSHDVAFISVQENMDFRGAIGKLVFNFFGSIAEFERELIRGRTHLGKIASAESGNFTGCYAPYGYNKVKNPTGKGSKLLINPRQAKWVKEIYKWYVFDERGPEWIMNKLNQILGVFDGEAQTKHKHNPTNWTITIVRKILTQPIYRGEYLANSKDETGKLLPKENWTVVATPVIIEPILWFQAQDCRKQRKTAHGRDIYLLSGKIRDHTVESRRFFIGVSRSKGGFSYRRKKFRDKDGIGQPQFELPAKPIEDYIWRLIRDAIKEPEEFYLNYRETKKQRHQHFATNVTDERKELESRLVEIENREIPRIQTAYEKGIYSESDTTKRLTEKEEAIQLISQRLSELKDYENRNKIERTQITNLEKVSKALGQRIDNFGRREQRTLCNLFVDSIGLWREPGARRGYREIYGKVNLNFCNQYLRRLSSWGCTGDHNLDAEIEQNSPEILSGGHLNDLGDIKSTQPAFLHSGLFGDFRMEHKGGSSRYWVLEGPTPSKK